MAERGPLSQRVMSRRLAGIAEASCRQAKFAEDGTARGAAA